MAAYSKVPIGDEKMDEKADLSIDMDGRKGAAPSIPTIAIPKQQDPPSSRLAVVGSVTFYITAAMTMIFANKFVLNAVSIPIFFLFCQLVIAVLLLQATALLGYITLPKIHMHTAREVAPLIAVNCTGLIFNTYCLQYVDASFYQIARGLVLPFTVFFSYIFLSARTSRPTFFATVVVCIGFFAGVSGEQLRVSQIGIVLGIFSSITTSIHAIVIKKTITSNLGGTLDLVYYNNALSAMAVSPLILFSGEWRSVTDMVFAGDTAQLKTFVIGTAITVGLFSMMYVKKPLGNILNQDFQGVFGFLLCIAGFVSIKVTSPVSHMISAAVRGVLQTFLGMSLFGDQVSTGRASGIAIILFGSVWYTFSKSRESAAAANAASVMLPSPVTMSSNMSSSTPSSPPLANNSSPNSRKASFVGDSNLLTSSALRRSVSAMSSESHSPNLGDSPKAKFS